MLFIAPIVMVASIAANTNGSTTAYAGANPVRIAACALVPEYNYYSNSEDTSLLLPEITSEKLKITFSNAAHKQISSVTFTVSDNGDRGATVVDVGTFSPGATIAHSFESPISGNSNLRCDVSSIGFADGSAWTQPLPAEAAAR
jgi:hypothetical protein